MDQQQNGQRQKGPQQNGLCQSGLAKSRIPYCILVFFVEIVLLRSTLSARMRILHFITFKISQRGIFFFFVM